MSIRDIPPEILSLILDQLFERDDYYENDPESPFVYEHLRNARLVCRQWNELATAHLFRTLILDPLPEDSWKDMPWRPMVNSEMIQQLAQDVIIPSHNDDLHFSIDIGDEASDVEDWVTEENDDDGDCLAPFRVAVDSIAKLPNLKSLQIHFSEIGLGRRPKYEWWEDNDQFESIAHRVQTLKAVFRAIQKRRAQGGTISTIRSLTLKNLQNTPIPEFTTSDLYKDVIKAIDELHLLVIHEFREDGPDHDIDHIERRTFEPHLQREILAPLAHQLRSLTLAFRDRWGALPGYFDGKGLDFPQLRTLTLGDYVIAHHDHFDWVLAQKSLETLRLDRCFIASYMSVEKPRWNDWRAGVSTHDWLEYPEGSFGFLESHVFSFDGTWETVYDRVREELPRLREFKSGYQMYHQRFASWDDVGASLSVARYIVFDSSMGPSPWPEVDDVDDGVGEMSFGNNDPAVCPSDATLQERWTSQRSLNRAKETELGDRRALEDLLRAVRERG